MRKAILPLLLLLCLLANAQQTLRLPRFFADGMILQRDARNPVWGWGKAGERVTVSMNGRKATTTVAKDGTWRVTTASMPARSADEAVTLVVTSGNERISISDILVGDVFLCSGQSNMELPIRRCMDAVADKVKGYANSNIRYLKLPHQYNYLHPNTDVDIRPWQDITPENCAEVSGVCYFMARQLQEEEHVPIGIINSAVGGTRVEAWMPQEVLAQFPSYKDEFLKPKYTQRDWVDSVAREENRRAQQWENTALLTDTVLGKWKAGYDFSSWRNANLFGPWFEGNGSYWFRKVVNIPTDYSSREGRIRVGAMKDADSVYVNGRCVGSTSYEYPPRIYHIPAGWLKAGENEIMVHLISQNGKGGFTEGKLYQIELGDSIFPLDDEWQTAQGCSMPPKPESTYFVDGNAVLYNAMIAPFRDLKLKGIVWYQGESNIGHTTMYSDYLEAMTCAWRKQLGKDYPLVIIQLPGFMERHAEPYESGWTHIRNQQYLAARKISNASLVSTLDTGEHNDIHPQDKLTVGYRAALQMQRLAYNRKIVATGPMPVSARIERGKVVISFSKETGRLMCKDANLSGFAILVGNDYQWAKGRIVGDYQLELEIPEGLKATTVRYGWDDFPSPSLFNTDNLPAPQFEIHTR